MFKKIMAALSAFILAGCLYADAEDLVIDGLGKLSFGEDVQITDGGGSRAETIFKKSGRTLTAPFICTRSGNPISAAPIPLPSLL